jgi:hypothetical protein
MVQFPKTIMYAVSHNIGMFMFRKFKLYWVFEKAMKNIMDNKLLQICYIYNFFTFFNCLFKANVIITLIKLGDVKADRKWSRTERERGRFNAIYFNYYGDNQLHRNQHKFSDTFHSQHMLTPNLEINSLIWTSNT